MSIVLVPSPKGYNRCHATRHTSPATAIMLLYVHTAAKWAGISGAETLSSSTFNGVILHTLSPWKARQISKNTGPTLDVLQQIPCVNGIRAVNQECSSSAVLHFTLYTQRRDGDGADGWDKTMSQTSLEVFVNELFAVYTGSVWSSVPSGIVLYTLRCLHMDEFCSSVHFGNAYAYALRVVK